MLAHQNTDTRVHQLHERREALSSLATRAQHDVQHLIARYTGQGLAVGEIPGLRRMLRRAGRADVLLRVIDLELVAA
jgi:hypothetical protein